MTSRLEDQRSATINDVKRMLEAKEHEILEFLGKIIKTVPRPHSITVKKKCFGTRKKVELTFKCARTGEELTCKSESWGLWLKFAISLLKTGTSVLSGDFADAVEDGMATLQEAYSAYNEKTEDQTSFESLMRAPLLLSKEQDELIAGLRKEGFFDRFEYNAQRGQWEIMQPAAAINSS